MSRTQGLLLILFTLLSWASVPLFLRAFKEMNLDAISANGWRYGISAVFWLPFLVYSGVRRGMPAGLLSAAVVPAMFNVAGQTTFAYGPYLLEPGFFTFIFRVQIVFVALGAYLLFPSERATLRKPMFWLGLALVVIGSLGLIALADHAPVPAAASPLPAAAPDVPRWIGIVVALSSGVFFAGYSLSVRKFVSHYSPVTAFGVICQYTALIVVPMMLLLGINPWAPANAFTASQVGLLVLSAFLGIAISHVTYYAALRNLGVATSSGIIQLQPVLVAVASTFIFDERLNAWQWACGLVGVCGAVVMIRVGSPRVKADEA